MQKCPQAFEADEESRDKDINKRFKNEGGTKPSFFFRAAKPVRN